MNYRVDVEYVMELDFYNAWVMPDVDEVHGAGGPITFVLGARTPEIARDMAHNEMRCITRKGKVEYERL